MEVLTSQIEEELKQDRPVEDTATSLIIPQNVIEGQQVKVLEGISDIPKEKVTPTSQAEISIEKTSKVASTTLISIGDSEE